MAPKVAVERERRAGSCPLITGQRPSGRGERQSVRIAFTDVGRSRTGVPPLRIRRWNTDPEARVA
jgi:hypothetical protein